MKIAFVRAAVLYPLLRCRKDLGCTWKGLGVPQGPTAYFCTLKLFQLWTPTCFASGLRSGCRPNILKNACTAPHERHIDAPPLGSTPRRKSWVQRSWSSTAGSRRSTSPPTCASSGAPHATAAWSHRPRSPQPQGARVSSRRPTSSYLGRAPTASPGACGAAGVRGRPEVNKAESLRAGGPAFASAVRAAKPRSACLAGLCTPRVSTAPPPPQQQILRTLRTPMEAFGR